MLGLTRSFLYFLSSALSTSAFADVVSPTVLPLDRQLKIYQ
ncbi:hypothetical protein [Burkholderia cenocepacia]|nr:hypothetical protein [Burkholderia cenocepacia]